MSPHRVTFAHGRLLHWWSWIVMFPARGLWGELGRESLRRSAPIPMSAVPRPSTSGRTATRSNCDDIVVATPRPPNPYRTRPCHRPTGVISVGCRSSGGVGSSIRAYVVIMSVPSRASSGVAGRWLAFTAGPAKAIGTRCFSGGAAPDEIGLNGGWGSVPLDARPAGPWGHFIVC